MTEPQQPQEDWAAPGSEPARPASSTSWGAPPTPPPYQQPVGAGPAAPVAPPTAAPTQAPAAAPLTYRSWQPGIVALRPLPFGDFLTVPFKAMRFNRGAIVGAPLIMFLASTAVTAVAIWLAVMDGGVADFFMYPTADFRPAPETIAAAVLAAVMWILSDVMSSAVVIPGVAQAALGVKLSMADALKQTLTRFWPLLGVTAIMSGAVLIVYALALTPVFIDIASGGSGMSIFVTLALVVLLVLPAAAVAMVYLIVARGVIVLERRGPIVAMRRAIKLVPGRFWWTILIVVVIMAINYAIQQVFSFGAQFVGLAVGVGGPQSDITLAIAFIAVFVLSMFASVVVQYSFAGSAQALVYLDMRFRKEGLAFDMARAAETQHTRTPGTVA